MHTQVLSTLGVLSIGTFQCEIGDRSGISQPTVSQIMTNVLHTLISPMPQYITFPNKAVEKKTIMKDFHTFSKCNWDTHIVINHPFKGTLFTIYCDLREFLHIDMCGHAISIAYSCAYLQLWYKPIFYCILVVHTGRIKTYSTHGLIKESPVVLSETKKLKLRLGVGYFVLDLEKETYSPLSIHLLSSLLWWWRDLMLIDI